MTVENTETQTPPAEPAPVGGPIEHGSEPIEPTNPPAPTETPPAEPPATEPLYSSSAGTFNTVDELVEHTKGLENKVLTKDLEGLDERNAASTVINPPDAPHNTETGQENTLSALLYSDPDRALNLIEDRVEKKMRDEGARKEQKDNFYASLYAGNQILEQNKDVVKFIVERDMPELGKMKLADAKKLLRKRSLDFIGKIARQTGGKIEETELATGNTTGQTGASGETPPKGPAKPEKIINFFEQVKRQNTRRISS